jgi:hypothetical protein
MLEALSSAMHADLAQERARSEAEQRHKLMMMQQQQQVLLHGFAPSTVDAAAATTVASSAPTASTTVGVKATGPPGAERRLMPSLPAEQLKSLVRSHVRHVGLSSKLKARSRARELREEQRLERQRNQVKAAKAVYLAPMPTFKAAQAAKAAAAAAAAAADAVAPPLSRRTSGTGLSSSGRRHSHSRLSAAAGTNGSVSASLLSPTDAGSSNAAAQPPPPPMPVVPWPSWLPENGGTAHNHNHHHHHSHGMSPLLLTNSNAAAASTSSHQPAGDCSNSVPLVANTGRRPSNSYGLLAATRLQEEEEEEEEGEGEEAEQGQQQHSRLPLLPPHNGGSINGSNVASPSSSSSFPVALSPRMPPIRSPPVSARSTSVAHSSTPRSSAAARRGMLQGSFAPMASVQQQHQQQAMDPTLGMAGLALSARRY